MKIPTSHTQPAFRQATLLTKSSFVSYCDKNNLRITEKRLQEWHKQKLLYPALRLFLGIVEYARIYTHHQGRDQWIWIFPHDMKKFKPMKIDRKKWYDMESLWMSGNWLDRWHANEYDFPSTMKYFRWKDRPHVGGWTTNRKLLEGHFELLYDKRQMLAVKIILKHEKEALAFPKEKRSIRSRMRKKLAELNDFLRLYVEIEELKDASSERMTEQYEKLLPEYQSDKKGMKGELKSHYKLKEQPRLEKEVKELLEKHHWTVEKIQNWRFWLAQQSHLNEGSVFRESSRLYLGSLNDAALVKAEDTNYMIWILNWFLYLITGEVVTVQDIVGSWIGPHCRFCHRAFIPRKNKPDQETCGRKECTATLRNLNRKPKRRKKTK
jgi:hypothetical protein